MPRAPRMPSLFPDLEVPSSLSSSRANRARPSCKKRQAAQQAAAPPPASVQRAPRSEPVYPEPTRRPEVASALYWRAEAMKADTAERRMYCLEMWRLCLRALSREPDVPDKTTLN